MKKTFLIISALFLCISTFAQREKIQQLIAEDTLLSIIYNKLPSGWTMTADDTTITVYRLEKFVTINSNCDNLNQDSIASLPRTETALMRFRYELAWTKTNFNRADEYNDSVRMILRFLPQEMGISHLKVVDEKNRGRIYYEGKTEKEIKKVETYNKRKDNLKFISLPNYKSTKYSLFQLERNCQRNYNQCIIPANASSESTKVDILFVDYCSYSIR